MGRTGNEERRRTALRALAGAQAVRGHAGRPAAVLEEALEAFGSEDALLLAAHQRWQVHLLARLDQLLEFGPGDPHDVVRQAVQELGEAMPGLATLLAEHADDPVLTRAQERLGGYVDLACPCGRQHALVHSPRPSRREPRACPLAARARAGVRRLGSAAHRRARWMGAWLTPVTGVHQQ